MIKSSLIAAIKTFSQKEIKEFGEFVNSPFFNKNANVIKLYEIIRKTYPDFEPSRLEKEKVFKKIFPSNPYKDSTMRLLMYYLFEVVEKFLAYSRFTSNGYIFKDNLLNELFERKLYKDFEKNIEVVLNEINNQDIRDAAHYKNKYIFAEHKLSYLAELYLGKYEKYLNTENIRHFSDNITYYYLISVLKYYAITLNTTYLYNVKFDTSVFENIFRNFNVEQFREVPLIIIYYKVIMLFIMPEDEQNFYDLKDLIREHEKKIDKNTISDLYINLENYCHRKVRSGNLKFQRESQDIYILELQSGVYLIHGSMPNSFFTSCVVGGCRLKEFEWVEKFIEKYSRELEESSRDSFYNYGLSYLNNDLANYEKALEYLAKVKFDEQYLKMDVRLLQCMIYYNLVWNLPLQSLLDTFKKTIQNNKYITEGRKLLYIKFIKYLNQMNNHRFKEDKRSCAIMLDELEREEYFPYKTWLIDETKKILQ